MSGLGTAVVAVVLILLVVMMYRWKSMAEIEIDKARAIKDPNDLSLTPSSTQWTTDSFCPYCKATTQHRERMSGICNSCGSHGGMSRNRSRRQIWDGQEWVHQFRYDTETMEIVKPKDCPPLTNDHFG